MKPVPTDRLSERRRMYDIPPIPYLPVGKNVLVFRLPNETVSKGGIIFAEVAQEPKPYGVLVGAGLGAMDVLEDHLVELGDIVWFGRFAGWEKEIARDPEGKGKHIIQLKAEDILGSVDALERVNEYELGRDDDNNNILVRKTHAS